MMETRSLIRMWIPTSLGEVRLSFSGPIDSTSDIQGRRLSPHRGRERLLLKLTSSYILTDSSPLLHVRRSFLPNVWIVEWSSPRKLEK